MDYRKLVETIPVAKREPLSNKLTDLLLSSKNDEKMPSQLANIILHHWQNDILLSESGLTALLEAATLLEPDKTIEVFTQLELAGFAEQLKEAAAKT
jgi:hypothetical protein